MQNNPKLAKVDQSELVVRAQGGDQEAFVELVARCHLSCTKLAISILRNREDAEDELQNAIWKAYRNIGRFQQNALFSTWMTRIVVNQCLMRLRRNKRARLFHVSDVTIGEEPGTLDLKDGNKTPEEVVGDAQVGQVFKDEIGKLPPLLRNVLVLRDVEQLPMQEVAGRVGVSTAAAKSRLLRARRELRVRMNRHSPRTGASSLLTRAA